MDFETIRPFLSGLIGGLFTIWLLRKLAKSLPEGLGAKDAAQLVEENRRSIFVANALFFVCLSAGVALYYLGKFERTDWRGIGLAFGCASIAPVMFLWLVSLGGGKQKIKEVYVAYALAQRTPTVILYGIVVIGSACLIAALTSLMTD